MSEAVPRGSFEPDLVRPLMVDGREGMEGRREGDAGSMGLGVPLGSGEGLMVKTEDSDGGGR